MDQQQHEMILETTHASGAEEWYCPRCGRRFLIQWPPAYNMIVIEPGDLFANHSGSKGGLKIGSTQLNPQNEEDVSDEHLRPWIDALDNLDFDW
jgi:hypothetical protein